MFAYENFVETYLFVTPVKNSLETVKKSIQSVAELCGFSEYIVFNDYSDEATTWWLIQHRAQYRYTLISAEDLGLGASPNQRALLIALQKLCGSRNVIFVESDVVIHKEALDSVYRACTTQENVGLMGVVTEDESGKICYPYRHISNRGRGMRQTARNLSFCFTFISNAFIHSFDMNELPVEKDWFDLYLSKKARGSGFKNYILLDQRVVHRPHSSRPWKLNKYRSPISYYWQKLRLRRDRT